MYRPILTVMRTNSEHLKHALEAESVGKVSYITLLLHYHSIKFLNRLYSV